MYIYNVGNATVFVIMSPFKNLLANQVHSVTWLNWLVFLMSVFTAHSTHSFVSFKLKRCLTRIISLVLRNSWNVSPSRKKIRRKLSKASWLLVSAIKHLHLVWTDKCLHYGRLNILSSWIYRCANSSFLKKYADSYRHILGNSSACDIVEFLLFWRNDGFQLVYRITYPRLFYN